MLVVEEGTLERGRFGPNLGNYDQARIGGHDMRIMGNYQTMLFDRPEIANDVRDEEKTAVIKLIQDQSVTTR